MSPENVKEATDIMLDKLKEMAGITYDECESTEGYASVCMAMCNIYYSLTQEK